MGVRPADFVEPDSRLGVLSVGRTDSTRSACVSQIRGTYAGDHGSQCRGVGSSRGESFPGDLNWKVGSSRPANNRRARSPLRLSFLYPRCGYATRERQSVIAGQSLRAESTRIANEGERKCRFHLVPSQTPSAQPSKFVFLTDQETVVCPRRRTGGRRPFRRHPFVLAEAYGPYSPE